MILINPSGRIVFFTYLAAGIFLAMLSFSCASTGELLAGPKDTAPPVLDTTVSTPNNQVRFQKQDIVLVFDEFIEVKDAYKQVLVSPPLNYLPKVTGRGKKVTFAFNEKEELRENVTYSIHFGDAIVDFREGNILSNFVFAFSTGDQLDSLTTTGIVIDAKTKAPVENVQVMFYDILEDSIVAKSRPYYAVKTDKKGAFSCTRMKSDTFMIIAIADKNVNFKYDLETEAVGFLDSLVITDPLREDISLRILLSTPETPPKLLAKNVKNYGRVELLYTVVPENPDIIVQQDSVTWNARMSKDTLLFFYTTTLDSFETIINQDTITVKTPAVQSLNRWPKTGILTTNLSNSMLPGDSLVIEFSAPIQTFDISKCKVTDTLGELADVIWNLDLPGNKLTVFGAFRSEMPIQITMDSSAFQDIFGRDLDSIGLSFRVLSPKQTASLELNFEKLDSSRNYFVTVKKGQTLVSSFSIENTSTFVKKLKTLTPEAYTIEIIQDENRNQKWDSGDYWNKRQPENMKTLTTEKLDMNRWTLFTVSWSEQSANSETPMTKKN